MDDIARLANVSKPTVSRALSDSPLVTVETRERILKIAAEHGYVVNRHAQKLRSKRTNTVAVVLDFRSHRRSRVADPFIFELLIGVTEALSERNQDLLLCAPGHSEQSSLESLMSSKGADGLIFLGQGARHKELTALHKTQVPFVVWGGTSDDVPYCVVGSDNVRGGYLVGRHLLQRGRSRFLFVGDIEHREIELRYQGLLDAISEGGTGAESVSRLGLEEFSYDWSYQIAKSFLDEQTHLPNAIFACSDTSAMAFITAFREAGIRVPEDIAVVGYNDIPPAVHFTPPITTIHQDVHTAGELLVQKLMEILNGMRPQSVKLKTELIVRQSS